MSRYIDADETFKHLQNRLIETAYNNVGYTIDADEVYKDVACFRLELWMHEIHEADVVEVVHGKWIPRTNLPKQEIFICSVCDGWAYSPWIGNRKNPKPNWCKYKYCPNCGAKMEVIK